MTGYGPGESNPSGFDDQGRWFEAARESVQSPGLALQWFGIVSLVLTVIVLLVLLVSPDTALKPVYDFLVQWNKDRPPKERQPIPRYEEFVKAQTTQNLIAGVLQLIGSLVIFYGGLQVRELKGYGWGIAGGVLAILPCNACCCIGFIFGAWALVALSGADVRLAFSRNRGVIPLP